MFSKRFDFFSTIKSFAKINGKFLYLKVSWVAFSYLLWPRQFYCKYFVQLGDNFLIGF